MQMFCVAHLAFSTEETEKANAGSDATANASAVDSETLNPNAISALNVYPGAIHLSTDRDFQTFVAQATLNSGVTQDISSEMKWQTKDPNIAAIDNGRLVPKSNGATALVGTFNDHVIEIPVTVEKSEVHPEISFKKDVMPVFMKTGCNQGSCHGAARGKDGFRLSLFGFDPDGDYHRLTREFLGRRINLALPQESLVLEKATGHVAHTGGNPIKQNDEYYQTILEWLKSGAKKDTGEVPTVESVELYPKGGVLDGEGATQQMTVRAKYSDGTDRDVTSLAYFMTNNENSASVSQDGIVTAAKRGEAFIMARFETHTVGEQFIVLPKGVQFQWNEVPEYNYIDTLIHNKLKKLRIQPSEICSDNEFIRRASLDICGVLPTIEETNAFVADSDPKKREKLVDQLLDRKEFVEIWVMKWSELLQIRSSNRVSYKSTLLYYTWLQERIADNVPIDQLVKELLGSSGGTFSNAATNYYENERDTLKTAENVAQVFMGMRIQCAQCHNHPFDRWTMDDYYSFAAFFSQIGRKAAEDPRERIIYNRGGGEVRHMVTNQVMQPKFLGGATPDVRGKDRRVVLAEWLASDENPYFAKNLANIVWDHFLGRGIIDEVDDVRISNPASNSELLDAMADKFTEYNYDFKKLVRDICTSRTYQLSTQTNETNQTDSTNFSHARLRRVRAEVLLDIISQVTETKNKFRGLPLGARAVQIADGNTSTYFLNTFGRAQRLTVCSCEVKTEPNLSQALHLLNGSTLQSKIGGGGVVKRWLDEGKSPAEIISMIYVRCLSREPSDEELKQLIAVVNENEDKRRGLEDLFWAVLNSREFVFNH